MARPEKVARLIQRCDSPYESESVAALKALRRIKEADGVNLGDYLSTEAAVAQSAHPDTDFRVEPERIKLALTRPHWLTFEERAFLQTLSSTPEGGQVSEDQMTYALTLFTRIGV